METIYQVNADDLNEDFLEGLKTSFKHKEIEIVVYERDETAYLLRSPANREPFIKRRSSSTPSGRRATRKHLSV